jgi:simple sugar transport system permease protein
VKAFFQKIVSAFAQPILAVMLGLALGLLMAMIGGDSPWVIFKALVHSAFGTRYDFEMTLFFATPIALAGLSVVMALRAGLFNIGAEGQMTLGALAAAVVASHCPGVTWPWAPLLAMLSAFLVGMLWGFIPGWLRARRGSHEVINTIMMNFIAAGLANYLTLYAFKDPHSQNPATSPIAQDFVLNRYLTLLIPLFVAWAVAFFFSKTVLGFEMQAVGANESAARTSGISVGRNQMLALALAGGIAGLAGIPEVLSHAQKFRLGFSPGYGFIGIAVALVGRAKPGGVLLAAFLFGALHKGTEYLELDTEHVTRDLSQILQAFVILAVSADGLWYWLKKRGVSA